MGHTAYAALQRARAKVARGKTSIAEIAARAGLPKTTVGDMIREGYCNRTLDAVDAISAALAAEKPKRQQRRK